MTFYADDFFGRGGAGTGSTPAASPWATVFNSGMGGAGGVITTTIDVDGTTFSKSGTAQTMTQTATGIRFQRSSTGNGGFYTPITFDVDKEYALVCRWRMDTLAGTDIFAGALMSDDAGAMKEYLALGHLEPAAKLTARQHSTSGAFIRENTTTPAAGRGTYSRIVAFFPQPGLRWMPVYGRYANDASTQTALPGPDDMGQLGSAIQAAETAVSGAAFDSWGVVLYASDASWDVTLEHMALYSRDL